VPAVLPAALELSGNCKGSGGCLGLTKRAACERAYRQFNVDTAYSGYTEFKDGRCVAFYKCDDETEYGMDLLGRYGELGNDGTKGISGRALMTLFESIHGERGCKKCGSVHWGRVC
jgi:hypothetical protein